MKLVIAIPTGGQLPVDFVKCLFSLQEYLAKKNIPYAINIQTGSFLPHTRAHTCGASLERGPHQQPFNNAEITHILMLDTDIVFTVEQIERLLSADCDMISGMYCYSTSAMQPENKKEIVAGFWNEEDFLKYKLFPPLTIGSARALATNNLLEVDWAGLGFALVKTSVFKEIEYPWFNSELIKIGDMQDTTSEDVGFCRKLTRLNKKIILDTSIRVFHLKTYPI